MATNFPGSLDSYTPLVDGSDYPQSAHINNIASAIEETEEGKRLLLHLISQL